MVSKYIIKQNSTVQNYLSSRHLSKPNIYKLITLNAITDDKSPLKLQDNVIKGMTIYIDYSALEDNSTIEDFDHKINILYENSEIIAIDKEKNILVHSDGETNKTILNAIATYLKRKGDDSFIRPIHRIDYATRGVVLFSKNVLAHSDISYQMENRLVTKKYQAICEGLISERQEINVNIGRNRHDSQKYIVSKTGKECLTTVTPIKRLGYNTILDVKITTGRPHQIRVSLAYIKHPVLGDELYGKKGKQLELISSSLEFTLDGEKYFINSKRKIGE